MVKTPFLHNSKRKMFYSFYFLTRFIYVPFHTYVNTDDKFLVRRKFSTLLNVNEQLNLGTMWGPILGGFKGFMVWIKGWPNLS